MKANMEANRKIGFFYNLLLVVCLAAGMFSIPAFAAPMPAGPDFTKTASLQPGDAEDNTTGVEVSPEEDARNGDPGETVIYTLTVTNTGSMENTFGVYHSSAAWTTHVSADILTLPGGASQVLTVEVEIPANAAGNESDHAVISLIGASASAAAYLITTANTLYTVNVTPEVDARSGVPNETVTYTLCITNTGNVENTFTLSVSGSAWNTILSPDAVYLEVGQSELVNVEVEIPEDAGDPESDTATVTVSGAGGAIATAILTTTSDPVYEVAISPAAAAKDGNPGYRVYYLLTVTNVGNITDLYTITVSNAAWTVTTPDIPDLSLPAGQSETITIQVEIPGDAANGEQDTANVTATGEGGASATASLTTTAVVVANPTYGVEVSPVAEAQMGVNGWHVYYQLTVTNTGNTGNTFDVAVSGATWPTTPSVSRLPLSAGESYMVQVTVQIPPGATGEDQDLATVTFSGAGEASAFAELTTTVDYHPPWFAVSISPAAEIKSGNPGTTVAYEMTVTNIGAIGATYDMAVTGAAWTTTYHPAQLILGSGTSEPVTVYVQIPADAGDGATDTATVTVSNGFASDSAVLTTSASPVTFGVEVAPTSSIGSGYPGQLVSYNLAITNTGNVANTFTILVSGGGWTTTPAQNSLALGAGESTNLAVTVEVPVGALAAAEETATVTVSGAGGANATATLTTTVSQTKTFIFLPLLIR